jgi:nicotine blue oxidoreductase
VLPGRRAPGPAAPVAGLVLAAGPGRRFGRPKAVARIDGERFVDRAVRVLREGGCAPVLVVLGAVRPRVPGAVVVEHDGWAAGQASSLRAGLRAAEGTPAAAVVIAVVDTPWVGPDAVRRLRDACAAGATIAVATYDGHPGHPLLVGRRHWRDLAATVAADEGPQVWLRRHRDQAAAVDCTGTGHSGDVDEVADLSLQAGEFRTGLDRLRSGSPAVAMLGAGMEEINALALGVDAKREEERRLALHREQKQDGDPPFGVDLDAGVVTIRRGATTPPDPATPGSEAATTPT